VSDKVIKYGPWEKHYFCLECDAWLSKDVIIFSEICPECGASGSILLPHRIRVRRKAYTCVPTVLERIFKGQRTQWHWETR
jgi:predicted RNA-binding Zn-ribbon protein involved in translation (DUF1610 family)